MSLIHVTPEPTSLAQVNDQCEAIEVWAEHCDSVPELRDATNKLAAINEYLTRTSTDGRARVDAAMRKLEVRIGDLLGPPDIGGDRKTDQFDRDRTDLSPDQRSDFRQMAANSDVVDEVIEQSTDDDPPSRRKVMRAIKQQTKPQRTPLPNMAESAGWQFRKSVERLETIFEDDRFTANKQQVAAHLHGHLSYAVEVCQDLIDQLNQDGE